MTVPKKKKGICVIQDMAAGMTKTEARKDCGVSVKGAKGKGKGHKKGKRKGHKKGVKKEKCHGKVHVRGYERSCPSK